MIHDCQMIARVEHFDILGGLVAADSPQVVRARVVCPHGRDRWIGGPARPARQRAYYGTCIYCGEPLTEADAGKRLHAACVPARREALRLSGAVIRGKAIRRARENERARERRGAGAMA